MYMTLFGSCLILLFQPLFGSCHLQAPPKGWECVNDKEQLPQKVEIIYVGSGQGQFTPSINIAREQTALAIGEYISAARSHHQSQGDTRCHLLGVLQTAHGDAHVLQIDRMTQWGPMRFVQAMLVDNGEAFVITATCLQEDFPSLSSQMFKAIQSFSLSK